MLCDLLVTCQGIRRRGRRAVAKLRRTIEVSDDPVRVGTTYVDRTPIGRARGQVLELVPHRRVVFRQALPNGALEVRITYELLPSANGTRLARVGQITNGRWLALAPLSWCGPPGGRTAARWSG